MNCAKKDCPHKALSYPKLVMWAKGFPRTPGTSMDMIVGMAVCEIHSQSMKVSDLMTDEGWEKIAKAMRITGRAEPDRASLQLSFVSIEEYRKIMQRDPH